MSYDTWSKCKLVRQRHSPPRHGLGHFETHTIAWTLCLESTGTGTKHDTEFEVLIYDRFSGGWGGGTRA